MRIMPRTTIRVTLLQAIHLEGEACSEANITLTRTNRTGYKPECTRTGYVVPRVCEVRMIEHI
jgi:hypothetical protein